MWLISTRWLDLVGTEKEDVVGVLAVLKELGWGPNARLNGKGKTMRELVGDNLSDRRELKRKILKALDEW